MTDDPVTYALDKAPTPAELKRLFAHTGWAADRPLQGIAKQIAATQVHATAWSGGVLIAYARAMTDGIYRALIDDVVVDPEFRRRRVGQELLRSLKEYLTAVEEVHLICDDTVKPFYETLGFRRETENNLMMHVNK